jgi:hypothetical protein
LGEAVKTMEKSGNIEDQVTDHLLRSYIKQQRQPEANCEGFDPDLASLYLERVLAEKEASRYEIHLFECSPCRNSVIALARFAAQETPFALAAPITDNQTIKSAVESEQKTVIEASPNWLERLQVFFGILATPRFALGAAAAIVLAISIPFVISQKGKNALNTSEKVAGTGKPVEGANSNVIAQAPPTGQGLLADQAANKDQAASSARSNSDERESPTKPSPSQVGAGTGSASGGAGAPATVADTNAAAEKKEAAKSDAASVAENKPRTEETVNAGRASEAPVASAPAPAPKIAERRELPRIDTKDTLRIPENDRDAAAKTIKPGRSDGTVATANKPTGRTIRPGDASAQPPATSAESVRRKGVVSDKAKSYRDEGDVRKERERASASRKIDNKTFWLIDDTWTDKDYKKDKELPVVTLIKESDVYREVLEKSSSLQKFFTRFAANEKVIVVYKGTVYRLIPR